MCRANRGYSHPQGFMGNETLEERNEVLESQLRAMDLESQLRAMILNLRPRIIPYQIGLEVNEQNMDSHFDSTHSMFSNTIGKVLKMAKAHHNYLIYFLLVFCMFVFLVLWFYIRY